MAELRSFIIGVTIAAAVLAVAYVAFGMGGGDENSPTIRPLTTTTATASRTTVPTNTRPPSTLAPGLATQAPLATQPQTAATATRTAVPIATATTAAPAPTQPPAATATPAGTSVALYKQRLGDLSAQVQYALGIANGPNPQDATWKANALGAAQNIQALAAAINGAPPPSCASSAHNTVSSGATTASTGAGLLSNGANSGDSAAISQAAGNFSSASQALNSGIAGVNGAC